MRHIYIADILQTKVVDGIILTINFFSDYPQESWRSKDPVLYKKLRSVTSGSNASLYTFYALTGTTLGLGLGSGFRVRVRLGLGLGFRV